MTHAGTRRISVVCPCYDETETVDRFYDELRAALDGIEDIEWEVIFVDDGSTDDTLAKLNALARDDGRVRVASLSRNFGHQIALTAGLDSATGDAVVMLDSDLQHPPELIPEMIAKWREGYDVVSAVRNSGDVVPFFKDITSKGFYRLLNRMSPTPVAPEVADFSLLARPVYESLRTMREQHRFVRGLISWTGFRRAFVTYTVRPRPAGRSKYTWRRMRHMALDAIFAFSSTPLRLATRIGFMVTIAGFGYLAWILGRALIVKDLVPGWASLIGVTLVLGGCQLLFIGLIGEYLARVFDEVKGRPLYVQKQAPAASRWAPTDKGGE